MAELSKFSSDFLTRLKTTAQPADPEPSADGDELALLHVFTPADLEACLARNPDMSVGTIWQRSVAAPGFRDKQGRSFRPAARALALTRIENTEVALGLLHLFTDRVMSPTQIHFENLLSGQKPDLDKLSHVDLLALQEANRWAGFVDAPTFDDLTLRRAVENAEAVASIGHLLQEDFVGRETEMAALREFTGVEEKGLLGRFGDYVHGSEHQLMLIEGLGGVGKTSLIGHFLHSSRNDANGPRFPFAYLPCDSDSVDVRHPHLLLADCAVQMMRLVSLYNPDHGVDLEYANFLSSLRAFDIDVEGLSTRISSFSTQEDRLGGFRSTFGALTEAFVMLCSRICEAMQRKGGAVPPALIFVDTFEEVQFIAKAELRPFWDLVESLTQGSPLLRVLVSGRPPLATPPSHIRTRQIRLESLDPRAAVELLHRDTGLPVDALTPVVRQIGGNPLNLRLAGRIIRDTTDTQGDALDGLQTRRLGLFRIGEEVIRGQLYHRVLDRIHDPEVRALAHPGMVLRRVTPALIRDVLADVAQVGPISAHRAQELFDGLRAEHTLVEVEADGALRYREDVRGPMVAAMKADQPEATERVHRAAGDWYAGRESPVEVAEFIYHALMSSTHEEALDGAWREDAAIYLGSSIAEMPPRAQIWLARRMSFELDDAVLAQAEAEEWEDIIGPDVLAMLEQEGSDKALDLLGQRSDRTADSPLFALEARCLLSLGQQAEAIGVLDRALAQYPALGSRGRKAELLWLLYQAFDQSGDPDAAAATLDDLVDVVRDMPGKIALVQALGARVGLGGAGAEGARVALLDALHLLTDADVAAEPDVARAGLAALSRPQAETAGDIMLRLGSNLFVTTSRGRFKLPDGWIRGITALIDPLSNLGGLTWLGQLAFELADRYVTERDMHAMLDGALGVLGRGEEKTDPKVWRAACGLIWEVLQTEGGSLRAATLAGIDADRPAWQRNTNRLALA